MESCSFTGHRLIESRHLPMLEEELKDAIHRAYEKGCRKFYAGGALGFDSMAALAVLSHRMFYPDTELHLVIPCRNQTERWHKADIDRYEYIMSRADTVEFLSDQYYDGCMRVRNQRLADLGDALIAYVGRDHSGSAQTLKMAQKAGKVILNLYKYLDSKLK